MNGKLIVIEGLDGSGKATQTELLRKNLLKKGHDIVKITFPDYESASSSLVKMYLNGELGSSPDDVNAYAAASFYAVDRYASYKTSWGKDYEQGKIILADRYATSNAIYQLAKIKESERHDFLKWIEEYEYNKLLIPKPDVVIYLDMPLAVSQRLMTKRYEGDESKKDLHERNVSFLEQCRKSALYAADKCGWNIVSCARNDAIRSIEEIGTDIIRLVESAL